MTERQKVFTSISGTVVVHLVLLLGMFLLLSFRSVSDPDGAESEAGEEAPKEVSILMSELMERIELEKAKRKSGRDFVNAEGVEESDEAPQEARYESDRNTRAASRLRPDELLPEEDGPTLVGSKDTPNLTLREREFRDGPEEEEPNSGGLLAKAAAVPPPPQGGGASSFLEQAASMQPVYLDPNAGPDALRVPPTKFELEQEERARELAKKRAEEEALPEIPAPEAFRPTSRQNSQNGRAEEEGEASVDAVKTAMGQYKQEVRKAIEVRWHRYRKERQDSVIWGMLKLTFRVSAEGEVQKLDITKNESNKTLLDISLRAIREAELPPMPPEVAAEVGGEGLEIHYDILTY